MSLRHRFLSSMTSTASLPPFLTFHPAASSASSSSSSSSTSKAAIIVVQEWWGLNDQIKTHAQHVATSMGCNVVVPDLYKGKMGVNAEEASHLMDNLDFKLAVQEMELLCGDLRKDDPQRKIGITGFCMGGALTLASVALSPAGCYQACAPFYGIPPAALCDVGDIVSKQKTPLQAHFGDLDSMTGFSDKDAVNQLEMTLSKADPEKKYWELHRYEKESHAFMNTDEFSIVQRKLMKFDDGACDPETQSLAWSRLFDFMKKHLEA